VLVALLEFAAFNFGAGLSFAVLPVAQVLGSPTGSDSSAGFAGGIGLGLLITAGALGVSFLIPRPAAAELGGAPEPADTAAAAQETHPDQGQPIR
jgi:hypothetical protein